MMQLGLGAAALVVGEGGSGRGGRGQGQSRSQPGLDRDGALLRCQRRGQAPSAAIAEPIGAMHCQVAKLRRKLGIRVTRVDDGSLAEQDAAILTMGKAHKRQRLDGDLL